MTVKELVKKVKILFHSQKLKEYKPPHYKMRVKERSVMDCSIEYVLGHFYCEYGFKDTPNSVPKPLLKPNRRAFLVQGRGLQGVVYLIDASGDTAAFVTVITLPHDEWGPLPERFRQYTSTQKK
jgi:hypothetical protein